MSHAAVVRLALAAIACLAFATLAVGATLGFREELADTAIENYRAYYSSRILYVILFALAAIAFLYPFRVGARRLTLAILIGFAIVGNIITLQHYLTEHAYRPVLLGRPQPGVMYLESAGQAPIFEIYGALLKLGVKEYGVTPRLADIGRDICFDPTSIRLWPGYVLTDEIPDDAAVVLRTRSLCVRSAGEGARPIFDLAETCPGA